MRYRKYLLREKTNLTSANAIKRKAQDWNYSVQQKNVGRITILPRYSRRREFRRKVQDKEMENEISNDLYKSYVKLTNCNLGKCIKT